MKPPRTDEIRKALFILTEGGVGDLLLSSPIIEVLKRRFQGCSVTCWVNPRHRPILRGNPHVDGYLDPPGAGFLDALRTIRGGGFDLAVIPWTTSRAAWLVYLAGIRYRVGQSGRLVYSWTFTHPVAARAQLGPTKRHWVDRQLDYARTVGCDVSGARPVIPLSDEERSRARELLAAHGVRPTDRLCCLSIGRDVPLSLRNWPVDGFVAAGIAIVRELGFKIVLTGSESEAPVAAEVEKRMGDGVINLAGRTDLRLLAAVIAEMDVVVCPDSGPSHIAAALGVPAVSIFAMKCDIPDRWRPYEDAHRVIVPRNLSCPKRCVREKCDYYECLNAIDAKDVVRAVAELTACGVT